MAVVLSLVAGEPLTPFQHAAMVADFTNQVCHWGSRGVGYINADATMTLSRPPVDCELGLRAADAVPAEGISIGTATLYDRVGALGTCVVTALSNGDHPVDLTVTTRWPNQICGRGVLLIPAISGLVGRRRLGTNSLS
nr:hypothetical protein [Nocardia asiatica]